MRGDDVLQAARAAAGFLGPLSGRDWSRPLPDLDFTIASVVAHACQGPLWYSLDLVGGPGDDAAFELQVKPDAEAARLLASLHAVAAVCAATVDSQPATARGFHPMGSPDPSGFAAMACDEILVHTYDAGTGLGEPFAPAPDLAGRLLARLFPWEEPDPDPWTALLRANGRIARPGQPRPRRWRWHCAPLADWDGTVPVVS
jgi:hypothetical protein